MPTHDCPTCKKRLRYDRAAELPSFPFCSERCRLVDLGRWLDEGYVISQPLAPPDQRDEDDDEAPAKPKATPADDDGDGAD